MKSARVISERPKEPESQGGLLVRVTGTDSRGQAFEQDAIATDISVGGALLVFPHRIGDFMSIGVSYEGNTARFRVVWASETESERCKVAVYKVEGDSCPWKELLHSENSGARLASADSGLAPRIQGRKDTAVSYGRMRRWRRHKIDVPIRVVIHGSNKTSLFDGRGTELSEGGMALTAGVELLPGDTVDIEFTPPYSGSPIRHTGTVRNRSGYRYGVEFLASTGEDAEQTERLLSTMTSM